MTRGALYRTVFPGQRVTRSIVREFRYRLPTVLGVTLIASVRELPTVLIRVAGLAHVIEPETGGTSLCEERADIGSSNILVCVACVTRHLDVLPDKRITSDAVVKF